MLAVELGLGVGMVEARGDQDWVGVVVAHLIFDQIAMITQPLLLLAVEEAEEKIHNAMTLVRALIFKVCTTLSLCPFI